jgi:hypothetical protein
VRCWDFSKTFRRAGLLTRCMVRYLRQAGGAVVYEYPGRVCMCVLVVRQGGLGLLSLFGGVACWVSRLVQIGERCC